MKKFIQTLLIIYALTTLFVSILPPIAKYQEWSHSIWIFEIFLVAVVIQLLRLITERIHLRYFILECLLEFVMVMVVSLGFNALFGWYYGIYIWVFIAIVVAVYTVLYIIGMGKIQRDVAFINEQINLRRQKNESEENCNDCRGTIN